MARAPLMDGVDYTKFEGLDFDRLAGGRAFSPLQFAWGLPLRLGRWMHLRGQPRVICADELRGLSNGEAGAAIPVRG